MTHFNDFGLDRLILQALAERGYSQPTPIQTQAIPSVMAGRDLLGIAQTGTGKTAAFALPILHRLAQNRKAAPKRGCRALILSPTRELASQIADSFRAYGAELGFSVATIFGGVSHGPQRQRLERGVDILVATPGRLLDHIDERTASLSTLEIFVLDEADQMLDMGFIIPIRKIIRHLPPREKRQNLFFSATMPADIGKLADELLTDPVHVSVAPESTTAERVEQQVVFVETLRKRGLLVELFRRPDFTRVLVFTRTKHGADRVARILDGAGVSAAAIHGNKSQAQRERALAAFKAGEARALVATDIAARGIDISSVSHVVQYDLPEVPEQYVHRIGRTARAGKDGSAVAFCGEDERGLLKDIERKTRQKIPSIDRTGDAALGELSGSIVEAKRPRSDQGRPHAKGGRGGRADQGGKSDSRGRSGDRHADRRPSANAKPPRSEEARKPDAPRGAEGKGKRRRNRRGGQGGQGGHGGQAGQAGAKSAQARGERPTNVFAAGPVANGRMVSAAEVMRRLGSTNPWAKT